MEKEIVVYSHIRKDTNEVFYIGIGVPNRPYRKDNRTKWWCNIVKKYGYTINIIKEGLTWEQATKEEIRLIKLYGRKDLGLGSLVNLTDGGEGTLGFIHSDKTKNLMRDKKKNMFFGEENPFYGKTHTDEAKKRMSKIQKGRKLSKKTIEKLKKVRKGQNNGNAKLKKEDVIWIRKYYIPRDKNYGRKGLSKKFNVSVNTISAITEGRLWKHLLDNKSKV